MYDTIPDKYFQGSNYFVVSKNMNSVIFSCGREFTTWKHLWKPFLKDSEFGTETVTNFFEKFGKDIKLKWIQATELFGFRREAKKKAADSGGFEFDTPSTCGSSGDIGAYVVDSIYKMPTRQGRFQYTDEAIDVIERALSIERLAKYLALANGDKRLAIRLYERNISLSEALYGVIQGFEIAFRNALHCVLTEKIGRPDWYDHIAWEEKEAESIRKAKQNIEIRGRTVTPDRVIAELTLGFWVQLTAGKYEKALWVKYLHRVFPLKLSRRVLFRRVDDIRYLRNRIAHHEPVAARDLRQDYAGIIEAIQWISPTVSEWVEMTNCFHERFNAPLQQQDTGPASAAATASSK
jgi:hypothetical protein